MKKITLLIIILPSFLFAQYKMFDKPLSPRIANYKIDCKLDVEKKLVEAVEVFEWKNTSSDYISEIQFHLYQNAFRNEKSTKFREGYGFPDELEEEINRGYCDIKKITLSGGRDITDRYRFIQPDDDNEDDRTVISLELPEGIPPGGKIEMEIDFVTKIPYTFGRCGFKGDYYLIAQWFPKAGVYIDGKWNCHQFHRTGEFFADFGVYDVKITVPENYTVGATGKLLEEKVLGNGVKQLHYYCEDVHDFAWTADTDYIVFEDNHKGIDITLLCQKENISFADNYLNSVKAAIDYYSNYGDYPWPVVTIVDPEEMNTGGMEYPTFFTGGAFKGIPESVMMAEMVTVHEFGHNYWQGMVANNEFEEAWLDEGINSYSTVKAMERAYPGKYVIDIAGLKIGMREMDRLTYTAQFSRGTILQPAWTYTVGEYGVNAYKKPGAMLIALERYFGEDVWMEVMRTFFDRWKFKHPKTQDFIDVVHEVTGSDMNEFFDQFLTTNLHVDFIIHEIKIRKGWKTEDKDKWYSAVIIRKDGHLIFPVEIEFGFADGTKIKREWDSREAANGIKYEFTGTDSELLSVVIDPRNIIEFEIYKTNNSWTKKCSPAGARKWALKFLSLFQKIIHLFGIFA